MSTELCDQTVISLLFILLSPSTEHVIYRNIIATWWHYYFKNPCVLDILSVWLYSISNLNDCFHCTFRNRASLLHGTSYFTI